MGHGGRERRRKGPVNRLRRLLYGLFLLVHSPYAVAAEGGAYLGKLKIRAAKVHVAAVESEVHFNPVLAGALELSAEGDLVPAGRVRDLLNRPGPALDRLLVKIVADDLAMIRNGVGLDLTVPDVGNFHLNLYSRGNPKGPQKRWLLTMTDDDAADMLPRRTWSFGASLEAARETPEDSRTLALVPQLIVDLDQLAGLDEQATAVVSFGGWHSSQDRVAVGEKVLQATFRWRF